VLPQGIVPAVERWLARGSTPARRTATTTVDATATGEPR
jgi:hypothetical protein